MKHFNEIHVKLLETKRDCAAVKLNTANTDEKYMVSVEKAIESQITLLKWVLNIK